ncbi:BRCA1-A complex subunit Abraxas 1 [Merluccius polli]|uniref:BRCA1-A complex subunit Abraxas 1 n=1 Tax=Merluccius polli TaxID=89951 RepID=A0AA47MJP7_MERPO|nr:BRCA1-A complex subunit Abraxas 1 [Merluccius polli]
MMMRTLGTRPTHLQDADQYLNVDPRDAQGEAEHRGQHDETQQHRDPHLEQDQGCGPGVLHPDLVLVFLETSRPTMRFAETVSAGENGRDNVKEMPKWTAEGGGFWEMEFIKARAVENAFEPSMADSTVYMPGIVLASVMFHHLNTDSDVEGFILGESKEEEKRAITDSTNDHVYFEHTICKLLVLQWSRGGRYGCIKEDVARQPAGKSIDNLIGWYRQRRNTEQRMTLRERLVYDSLMNALANPDLIFLLLTPSEVTSTGSTHETEYAAFRSHNRRFHKIPVVINNLGSQEDVVYRTSCAPCSSAGYHRVVQKHKSKFFSQDDTQREVMEINKMYSSMQAELQKECKKVEKSEQEVQMLLAELTTLRKMISKKKSLIPEKGVLRPSIRGNLLLENSLKRRFPHSPLFHTQTLTIQGIPVAERLDPPTFTCPQVASDPEP